MDIKILQDYGCVTNLGNSLKCSLLNIVIFYILTDSHLLALPPVLYSHTVIHLCFLGQYPLHDLIIKTLVIRILEQNKLLYCKEKKKSEFMKKLRKK